MRHNIEQTADDFAAADVHRFDTVPVTVGSGDACDCTVHGEPELAPHHFTITATTDKSGFQVAPENGLTVYLNANRVPDEGGSLTSGDELRVGHATFRFQRIRSAVGQTWRADLLVQCTKLLIGIILLVEIGLAYWLPRRLESETLLAAEAQRQRTIMLLDTLGRRARKVVRKSASDSLQQGGAKVVADELSSMADFVRKHEHNVSRAEWHRLQLGLLRLQEILGSLEDNKAFPPSPRVNVEGNVIQILDKHQAETLTR